MITTETLVSPISTYLYSYDTVNKDRLISYNGETCTYDSKGNPTVYRNNNLTWSRVRLLTGYGNNTFAYNADGIRVRKNNTTYTLDGSNIIKESRNGNDIIYYYDETGVCGFCYNGKNYFYVKNLQGDVIEVYDENKVKYAEYVYDAWGNHTITVDVDGIGTLNPFRYRSYYYDTETGLYYLKSRYYDPEVGRFISQDELLDQRSILGYNLFAYCANNPVMGKDPTGKFMQPALDFAGTAISQSGQNISNFGSAYESVQSWAYADGLYPFGDVLALLAVIAITGVAVGKGVYTATKSISWSDSKAKEKEKEIHKYDEPEKFTYLYRAMGYVEYNRFMKFGRFSSNWDTAMNEKFFATNVADAHRWGHRLNGNEFKIVEITLPKSALSGMNYYPYLDSIGPAYSAPVGYVNSVMISYRGVY